MQFHFKELKTNMKQMQTEMAVLKKQMEDLKEEMTTDSYCHVIIHLDKTAAAYIGTP